MSTLPDNDFDLEKLFLPAWAQEGPSAAAKYAKYEGETERPDRREGRRGPRGPRREGFGGPRPDRDRRPNRGPGGPEGGRFGRPEGAGGRPPRGNRRFGDRREERPRREPPPPLPEITLSLIPEDKGVESLARQIKMTGRAYPLFDIAQMILQKPDRHLTVFNIKKNAEGKVIQPLFVCALDDTLWLSEDEAVGHVLRKHFATFYQAEKTATEPPKGKYTFVAQCGMSGVVLGPPNYHDYQNQLRKLHAERFSRMPFEVYKSRVKIVRDEAVVKKWVDDQSWKTDYICLNLPEPLKLASMEAVEKHFRETHKENIIKQVETHRMTGAAARNLRSPELVRLVRAVTEDQRRFPLQIATVLSQQFASHGLQFFKVNKTITHVSVARPHYLDLALIPVSEGVKGIVEFINANPRCTRRKLVESLAPSPQPGPIPVAPPPGPAPAETAPVEGQPTAATSEVAATPPSGPPASQLADGPTPEQTAVIADLHWLIHQGHVIEFANGTLETAKKPVPKPPRPEKPKPAEAVAGTGPAGETAAITGEAPAEAATEQPGGEVTAAESQPPAAENAQIIEAAPAEAATAAPLPETKAATTNAPETALSDGASPVASPEPVPGSPETTDREPVAPKAEG